MTLLLNTSEFKYQKYFMNIKKRIEFYWEYPLLAARKGQQGRLTIDFVINRDGTIETTGIDIIKSVLNKITFNFTFSAEAVVIKIQDN